MREGTAPLIRREDYAAPAYWIRKVDLTFDLDPAKTLVSNKMQVERNPAVAAGPLKLHGEDITLIRCLANGESVSFRHEDGLLVIDSLPEGSFTLASGKFSRARRDSISSIVPSTQANLRATHWIAVPALRKVVRRLPCRLRHYEFG